VVFLGLRANAELAPKFHIALHASHAALPMVTLNILPYSTIILIFEFDFGLNHPVYGGYKYRDLTLQAGGISRIGTIKYGFESYGTQT
jgi:hypothetical protein